MVSYVTTCYRSALAQPYRKVFIRPLTVVVVVVEVGVVVGGGGGEGGPYVTCHKNWGPNTTYIPLTCIGVFSIEFVFF